MNRSPVVRILHENIDNLEKLVGGVNELMDSSKGVLGLDEHALAFEQPFNSIHRTNDWENRRLYRQLISTAPLQEQFSAALLSDEFIKQSDDEATEYIEILSGKGLLLGVRIDIGMSLLIGTRREYVAAGTNNINNRLKFYKDHGCKYSKWRSVYQIRENCPTLYGTICNSVRLGNFAIISQNVGLVPIVSVEVLPDGSEDIYMAGRVLEKILNNLLKELNNHDVSLEAMLLQVSFVQPGRQSLFPQTIPQEIAEQTIRALQKSLPIAIGGIMFHSSGLSEEYATQTFNHIMIMKLKDGTSVPWKMTYAFGRGQQASAIMTWKGDPDLEEAAQREMMVRAAANNKALKGEYEPESVRGTVSDMDMFIPNYTH